MVDTVVFLWISAASASAKVDDARPASVSRELSAPSREAISTLADFGAARGVSFVPLAGKGDRPLGLPANDPAIVDELEAELEQARTALSTLEEASASARLSRVERQLLTHPHLPQASFLMGECLALQAQAERERSPALARALESRRAALEGARAAAFGAPALEALATSELELTLSGLGVEDELELDGASLGAARRVRVLPGLHHARVWRRGRPVFASFVEIAPDARSLALAPPRLEPCGAEDLEHAGEPVPGPVACSRWARVRVEGAGVGVSLCERQRCGAFVHWQRRPAPGFTPIPVEHARALPSWAGFAIAGAAALAAGSLVLWQSGAFERGRPNAASWEFGGLNP